MTQSFQRLFMVHAWTAITLPALYLCPIIKSLKRIKMTETEKNHSFQRVQLMKQAAVIRQNNGMNRHDALVTAHRIGALIRQMHHGNVCFRYTN